MSEVLTENLEVGPPPSGVTSTCVNCGETVATPFCASCGQRHPPKKLNLITLYTDFQSRIYGFDGMFPRTLRDLTIRPGHVAQAYIGGNRVRYVAPVGYFFLVLTVFLLLMELLGITFADLSDSMQLNHDTQRPREQVFMQEKVFGYFNKNMRLFSFALIPINAAFAWLFFRKAKLNLLEHSILIFYTSGHLYWISVLNLFLIKFAPFNVGFAQVIIQLGFYAFAAVTFYKIYSRRSAFIRGLLVSTISFIVYMLFMIVFLIIVMIDDPQVLEKFREGPKTGLLRYDSTDTHRLGALTEPVAFHRPD